MRAKSSETACKTKLTLGGISLGVFVTSITQFLPYAFKSRTSICYSRNIPLYSLSYFNGLRSLQSHSIHLERISLLIYQISSCIVLMIIRASSLISRIISINSNPDISGKTDIQNINIIITRCNQPDSLLTVVTASATTTSGIRLKSDKSLQDQRMIINQQNLPLSLPWHMNCLFA